MKKNALQMLLFIIALMYGWASMAQADVKINLNDGSTSTYHIAASGRLYFDNDNLVVVTETNATHSMIALESIRSLHFNASNNDIATSEYASFQLSPNPTQGSVVIDGMEPGIQKVTVFALDGTTVFQGSIDNGQKIDLAGLPRGIYFVKVGNHCEKLIKQ